MLTFAAGGRGRRGGGAESASSRLIEPNLAQEIKSSPGGYYDFFVK